MSLLLSHLKDDSYTPQKLSIKAGTGTHDLTEVRRSLLVSVAGHTRPGLTRSSRPSQVTSVHFEKPEGWQTVDLRDSTGDAAEVEDGCVVRRAPRALQDAEPLLHTRDDDRRREPISAFLVKITVVANHLNGKDTHIRGLKIWGPQSSVP